MFLWNLFWVMECCQSCANWLERITFLFYFLLVIYLFKIIKWKIKNIQPYIRYSISYIFNASIIFENWTKLWSDSFIVLIRTRTLYSAGNAWTKCAQTSILANANVISAWHVGARDTRNRGHEPKIISVCCSIRRDSLWESRQPTLAARRETVEAAKYFSAPDIVLFFGRTECEFAYTNFPTSGVAEDTPSLLPSEFPFSHRNCHFLL